MVGCGGKDLQKRKVLSLEWKNEGVMDDESGESMEPMEEVPLHRKFEPRVRVWKLKEKKTCEEYRHIVGDKAEEAKWKGLGVNDHWQQMKGIMMETA